MAADWQRFEDEKDVLPNLRWIPSTAAQPDAFHQSMWDTVLPVDHPFWSAHHPGDRWGCQCGLEATDDPVTPTPTADYRTSPGFENNPGIDAKLFNETHPYFPDSCNNCPFHNGRTLSGPTNLNTGKGDCGHCQYIDSALPDKKEEILTPDKDFGEHLLVSSLADPSELKGNIRCAKSILGSYPEDTITKRAHSTEPGVKNPEYLINNLLGDRKGIESEKGIKWGFISAIEQGCKAIVIDLDERMSQYPLRTNDIAKFISWRHRDFEEGRIDRCYIVFHEKAVMIDASYSTRGQIADVLKQLKP